MTQLTSLPILAGAMALVNLLSVYIVNIMTVALQQGVENKGIIILFTVVIVVAINGYLLTLFSNLQKGGLTAKVLSKIKFPTSAKELFSNIGKVGAGAAMGAGGAALASGKGRSFINKLTSFKRNQSLFSKFGGKTGQKLAGLSANLTNAFGDKMQNIIDGRDAKIKESVQNISSGKLFERYLNKIAFKPGLQKAEIMAIVDKANELIKSNDLGIEAEGQVKGLIEKADPSHKEDEKFKKAEKKFKKGAIASYSEDMFTAKTPEENEKAINAFIKKLGEMGTDDYAKLNFKAIDAMLKDKYPLFAKQLLKEGLDNGGIGDLFLA
jgi:hypothetical protein